MSCIRFQSGFKTPDVITLSDNEDTIRDPYPMKKIRKMAQRESRTEPQLPQPDFDCETPKRRKLSHKEQIRVSEFTPIGTSQTATSIKTYTFLKNGRLEIGLCDTRIKENHQHPFEVDNEKFKLTITQCGTCSSAAQKNSFSSYLLYIKNLYDRQSE